MRTTQHTWGALCPGKAGKEWLKTAKRYKEKILAWNWSALGLFFATTVYNVYILPALGFTAQVAEVGKDILKLENWGMNKAAPGPGMWCIKEDLHKLQKYYGCSSAFGSISITAQAAQLRVLIYENEKQGGIQAEKMGEELDKAYKDRIWSRKRWN